MKESESEVTLLAVPESRVLGSEDLTSKNPRDVGEIDTVLREIGVALRFGPGEADIHCIYTPYIRQGGGSAHCASCRKYERVQIGRRPKRRRSTSESNAPPRQPTASPERCATQAPISAD